jgi:hypothetical protein
MCADRCVRQCCCCLQRGITRLKRFHLSKIYGSIAATGVSGPQCFSVVRSQADIPGGNGTRMYVCGVRAARQAIHVLSLSAAEVTYIGDLAWPSPPSGVSLDRDLRCVSCSCSTPAVQEPFRGPLCPQPRTHVIAEHSMQPLTEQNGVQVDSSMAFVAYQCFRRAMPITALWPPYHWSMCSLLLQ